MARQAKPILGVAVKGWRGMSEITNNSERRDPIVEAVRADLLARSQVGIRKYGVTLAENPIQLRDWLQHAYEEALDMANYLKAAMVKLDSQMDDGK